MKITVLMDSFKGSLSSEEAGEAVRSGIVASGISAEISVFPFADGGEGTLDAFLAADRDAKKVSVRASDPLGRPIDACYGVLSDGTAVIEMAKTSGLCLLSESERNPLITTTRGVGQLIRHAISNGHKNIIIALGGSATNDCGAGMLRELGLAILDKDGKPVCDGALGLAEAKSIDAGSLLPGISDCSVIIAGDVENPLYGDNGASRIFAPQKGASAADIEKMDAWMKDFSKVVKTCCPAANPDAKGAGAAGGLGFALQTFLGGKMIPGANVLLSRTGLEGEIASSDLVITGEGAIDGQTAMGKAPARIASLAGKYNVPVIAVAGCIRPGAEKCHDTGIKAIFPILSAPMSIKEAMAGDTAKANISRTVCEIMRLFGK